MASSRLLGLLLLVSVAAGSGVPPRWLQNTVHDLRAEMRELARSLNVSAALGERQRTAAAIGLLRSDAAALARRFDGARLAWHRDAAQVQQLRQDVDELRLRLQDSASQQQRLRVEIDALKEELREQIMLSKNSIRENSIPHFNKEIHTNQRGHRQRHWRADVADLQNSVAELASTQTELRFQMASVIKNQGESMAKLDNLQRSEPQTHKLQELETVVNQTEQKTLDIQSRVDNITMSGIKKLHDSTVQLFNALKRLESDHDQTTDDIRKEISKLDYNLSQTQSDFEELRDRHSTSEQVISAVKGDVSTLQSDTKSNHLRILLVQNAALNWTVPRSPDAGKLTHLESQIQSLTEDVDAEKKEIEQLHRQVAEKDDDQELILKTQRKVRESILQFKAEIPSIQHHQDKMEHQIEELVKQLPKDCSEISGSGSFLLQAPQSSPLRVQCDHGWTVVQRRAKGDQDFNRGWDAYRDGFGDPSSGDFWLGNSHLHRLTSGKDFTLRIDLWNVSGHYKYAEYQTFRVLSEADKFRLALAGYRGNASDALGYHNGMAFSTPDKDQDASASTHCAAFYHSGWWYNHCQYVNINGGLTWYDSGAHEWTQLSRVQMKIRPSSNR